MNVDLFENTVQGLVKNGSSGLTCIWAKQNRERPPLPFVSLEVVSSQAVGEHAEHTTSDIGVGDTVTLTASQHVELSVAVTAFTADVYGNGSALNIVQKVRAYLAHETALAALDAADIGLIECSQIQDLSGILATEFQGQAVLNLRLRVKDSLSEAYPYIGQADITTDIEGDEEEISVVLP